MTDRNKAAREALLALRERYRGQGPAITGRIVSLARDLAAAPGSLDVIELVRREAHRIHGTAGTYGFAEVSRLAAALEARCTDWTRNPALAGAAAAAHVEETAEAIGRAFEAPAAAGGTEPR